MSRAKEPVFLTSLEAAEITGYTPDHIGLLLRRGMITGIKPGRDWLIEKRAWMNTSRQDQNQDPKALDNISASRYISHVDNMTAKSLVSALYVGEFGP